MIVIYFQTGDKSVLPPPVTLFSMSHHQIIMITSSNENIFRFTGHLCREFIGHRWISRTKASDAELWCFLVIIFVTSSNILLYIIIILVIAIYFQSGDKSVLQPSMTLFIDGMWHHQTIKRSSASDKPCLNLQKCCFKCTVSKSIQMCSKCCLNHA